MIRVWSTLVVFAVALVMGFNAAQAKDKEKKGEKKPPKVEDVFKRLDKNNDGKLSKEEFAARAKDPEKAKAQFAKIDKDRDGSVSLDEFKAWVKKVEEKAKKKAEKKGDSPEKK